MRSVYRRARWRVRKRKKWIAAAAVVVAAAVLTYVLWPGPNLRIGSTKVAGGSVDVGSRILRSYEIVYRVESRAGEKLDVATDDVFVRRPFEARVETSSGGKQVALTVNGFGRVRTSTALLAVPPSAAAPDLRPDVFVKEAQAKGYALEREPRRVLGRICRVYRIADDSGSSSFPPVAKTPKSYSDICVDGAGLALENVSFSDGKLLSRRIATRVVENPKLDDKLFDVAGEPVDAKVGGGSVREVTGMPPGSFWELPGPPGGFVHKGRYAVIPPQGALTDPRQRSSIIATIDDVWVNGPDVLIVEQGGTLGGADAFGSDPNARRVHAGSLGDGQLSYALRSSEVRVKLKGGHFVIVEGTLAPSRLLAIASSLVKVGGGTLSFR